MGDREMKISRRAVMQSGLSLAAAPAIRPAQSQLPNILLLISDDHSKPHVGCYGDPIVHTPNLDRLAREGARFNNCFVASPQCSPNRSAIFTGCTPHTIGTSRLHTPMPPWERTFLEGLKEKGYFVGAFRKVHQGEEFNKRFDFYGDRQTPFQKFFDALPKGRPFFLQFGSTDPHRPYRPGAFRPPHDPAKVPVPPFLPDTAEVRQDLAHYYDAIARFDAECGKLMELLRRNGLEENTMVVFTGDNGMPFPRAKGTCYDPGIQVPLVVWWPGRVKPGAVYDELISHVDLPATWLEVAGVPRPEKMQGRSFLNLLLGREYQRREAVFCERNWHDNFDPIRAVRTGRYKLIFNAAPHFPYRPAWDLEDSPSWAAYLREARRGRLPRHLLQLLNPTRPVLELYDLHEDPNEFHNLASSPDHAELLRELMQKLSDWMHDTYDFLPPAFPRPGEPAGRNWPTSL